MDDIILWIAGQFEAHAWLRVDLLGELLLAAFLGGVIGWERESKGKPAGLRTQVLICIGATLLTDLSIRFGQLAGQDRIADPARITAQIVTGVGFLGAGTIMQAKGAVIGLTTAATLWVVAAIGIAVGSGAYLEATGTSLLVLVTLVPLGWVEDRLEQEARSRVVRVILAPRPGVIDEVTTWLEGHGVRALSESVEKDVASGRVTAWFRVRGTEQQVRALRTALLEWDEVYAVQMEMG